MARMTFACFRRYRDYCLCGLDRKACDIGHVCLEPFARLECVLFYSPERICLQDHGEVIACRV